jgi:hypothetical protein
MRAFKAVCSIQLAGETLRGVEANGTNPCAVLIAEYVDAATVGAADWGNLEMFGG